MKLIQAIDQLLCMHEEIKRTDVRTGELFLGCLKCTWTSSGVETGPSAFLVVADRDVAPHFQNQKEN
jgi:hypothetical protein